MSIFDGQHFESHRLQKLEINMLNSNDLSTFKHDNDRTIMVEI